MHSNALMLILHVSYCTVRDMCLQSILKIQ